MWTLWETSSSICRASPPSFEGTTQQVPAPWALHRNGGPCSVRPRKTENQICRQAMIGLWMLFWRGQKIWSHLPARFVTFETVDAKPHQMSGCLLPYPSAGSTGFRGLVAEALPVCSRQWDGLMWATDRTKLLFEFASWLCKVQVTQSTQSFRGAEADFRWFQGTPQDDTKIWQAIWWLECETWLTQVSPYGRCSAVSGCICHPVTKKKKGQTSPLSSTTQGLLHQSVPNGRVLPRFAGGIWFMVDLILKDEREIYQSQIQTQLSQPLVPIKNRASVN